jgi:hypothetical protein
MWAEWRGACACATGSSRERDGSVTDGSRRRDEIVTGGSRRGTEATEGHEGVPGPSPMPDPVTKSVRSPRFRPCCPTATDAYRSFTPPWWGQSPVRVLGPSLRARRGPRGPGSVTFPASSSTARAGCAFSRATLSRKSDFHTDLCRMFHAPLTSWASHGGHSQTGPPGDAQEATRTGGAAEVAASRTAAAAANRRRTAAPATNHPPTVLDPSLSRSSADHAFGAVG